MYLKHNDINDVKENRLLKLDRHLLEILLKDMTTENNIIWATSDYISHGDIFSPESQITVESVTGKYGNLIKPRVEKSLKEQKRRSTEKAEVFTSAWLCNYQNNMLDAAWFGYSGAFNKEVEKGWITNEANVVFPDGKTWEDYVLDTRLEITCGEAPYLVNRYDSVEGKPTPIKHRIGLLDRKIRVISENVHDEETWLNWVKKAVQNCYGYDWQGDNVLLARENMLFSVIEHFDDKFNKTLSIDNLIAFAEIIAWNIWQMDGLKCVIPYSCKETETCQYSMLGNDEIIYEPCPGCKTNNVFKHTGTYCLIKDWVEDKVVRYVDLMLS